MVFFKIPVPSYVFVLKRKVHKTQILILQNKKISHLTQIFERIIVKVEMIVVVRRECCKGPNGFPIPLPLVLLDVSLLENILILFEHHLKILNFTYQQTYADVYLKM